MKAVDQRRREIVCAGQISSRVVARQRKSRDVRLVVKWSQIQLQSGSAQYAPTRPDAIVVVAETPCGLVATAVEVCPSVAMVCRKALRTRLGV